jgi:hypothetical protein
MIVFQMIAIPLVLLLCLRSVARLLRGERPRWSALLGAVVWLGAAAAIFDPDLTNRAAGWLGIGRGADLLIYVVALAFAVVSFYFYTRLRRLESNLTVIVRELALRDHETPPPPAED